MITISLLGYSSHRVRRLNLQRVEMVLAENSWLFGHALRVAVGFRKGIFRGKALMVTMQ